ncbi:MAG TPA: SulP family inorganic anion transporter [Gaiellaceae bacterium]|nr:SulP family inorganic anion transporter [Gaiellaceae bacterium]
MSASAAATKGGLGRYVSVLDGIRPYRREWLSKDVVAGVTLAALAIPETMGYTKIAGMPVITGLYTILFPIAAFALLGSSKHLVVGADSATAAIMYAGIASLGIAGLAPDSKQWVALAGLSALLAGGLLIVARIARLGFLSNFLSRTVLVGFLTGVGIQVAAGQVGGMLGIPKQTSSVGFFSDTLVDFFKTLGHLGDASWQTALVSAATLAILVVGDRWMRAVVPSGLVAVVGMIALSWIFDFSSHDVSILGPVPSGLPHVGVPNGVTIDDAAKLMATAISMFVVILAQSAATSRAYAVKYSEQFDENTDLVGLGVANIAAGFTGTFVVNGSPTKTEMVDEAKSHTQVAQLTTAVVVAIVLLFLTKPLQYLPNCVLSSVVFLIGVKLVDVKGMHEIYRLRRDEFYVALLTAIVVVTIGVEEGIILAIVLSLVLHVRRHYLTSDFVLTRNARGRITAVSPAPGTTTEPGLVVYRFGGGIFYANAERLSDEMLELVSTDPPPRWFVLDAAAIDDIDFTGGKTLGELADQLRERGVVLAFCEVTVKVRRELDAFGITGKIGAERIYETVEDAIEAFGRSG